MKIWNFYLKRSECIWYMCMWQFSMRRSQFGLTMYSVCICLSCACISILTWVWWIRIITIITISVSEVSTSDVDYCLLFVWAVLPFFCLLPDQCFVLLARVSFLMDLLLSWWSQCLSVCFMICFLSFAVNVFNFEAPISLSLSVELVELLVTGSLSLLQTNDELFFSLLVLLKFFFPHLLIFLFFSVVCVRSCLSLRFCCRDLNFL